MKNTQIIPSKGFSLIELLVVLAIMGIIFSVTLAIMVGVLRGKARAGLNSEVRSTGNETMLLMTRNIKDAVGFFYEEMVPVQNQPVSCLVKFGEQCHRLLVGSVPRCDFSSIRVLIDDVHDRVFALENGRILLRDINKDKNDELVYPLSPKNLVVNRLLFSIDPALCYSYDTNNRLVSIEPAFPGRMMTINLTLDIGTQFKDAKDPAYKQANITLKASSTLRN